MRKYLLALVIIACALRAFSQGAFVPMGSEAYYFIDRMDIKYSRILPVMHTADKTFYRGNVARFAETLQLSNLRFSKVQKFQLKWLTDDNPEWLDSMQSRTRRPLFKKLYTEPASFFSVYSKKKGAFDLHFNPIFSLNVGIESFDKRFVFSSARGVEVRGNIKRTLSFYFSVFGNAERMPYYATVKSSLNPAKYYYLPGEAYWKDYESKLFKFKDGKDYFDARGYVNVNVLKYINVSIGRDKFFIGNGQRSLFLSDYSAPYLFLKMDIAFWRVKYTSILAELNAQYKRGGDQLLPKKYMAVHHLSIQATHGFNFGFFEGVVMQRSTHFELQYLNPIIFYRAVEHSIGSPDNVLLGVDFKLNLINHLSFYGQLALDEFNFKYFFKGNGWWANKFGVQMGVKYIDLLPNLDAQLEVNVVRPYTYTHEANINYTHYNQPLAHPLGANFYEVLFQLHYQPLPELSFNAKYFVARTGEDSLLATGGFTNYGGDILTNSGGGTTVVSEFGNKIGQGVKATINYLDFTATYQPWHNIYFDLQLLYRSKSGSMPKTNEGYKFASYHSTFVFNVGLRMNIGVRRFEF